MPTQVFDQAQSQPDHDFDWLFGAATLDQSFDEGLQALSRPDDDLWDY